MRRAARIRVSEELLLRLLDAPPGTHLLAASYNVDGFVVLTVAHSDLAEVPEGLLPPFVDPVVHKVRWDWNQ